MRARYKAAYNPWWPLPVSRLVLYYVSEDRMCVDWLESVLRNAGFEVTPRDVWALPRDADALPRDDDRDGTGAEGTSYGSERLLAVVSRLRQLLAGPPRPPRPPGLGRRRTRRGRTPWNRPVAVRVDDIRLGMPQSGRGAIDLSRLDEERAYTTLLTGLDHPDVLPARPGAAARFPDTGTRISNVQPRYDVQPPLPVVHRSLPGLDRLVGKSQPTREYAHRCRLRRRRRRLPGAGPLQGGPGAGHPDPPGFRGAPSARTTHGRCPPRTTSP